MASHALYYKWEAQNPPLTGTCGNSTIGHFHLLFVMTYYLSRATMRKGIGEGRLLTTVMLTNEGRES